METEGGLLPRPPYQANSTLTQGNDTADGHKGLTTTTATATEDPASFYITTAINYTNGPAHMGHAYEAATSDAIARFVRLQGSHHSTYFVTGADEHGQKIANTAAAIGQEPMEICDKVSSSCTPTDDICYISLIMTSFYLVVPTC